MIVAATQRSGTKTISEILGIRHEVQFTVAEKPVGKRVDSEVSWMVTPYLNRLRNHKIIHLIRHPLRVINSIIGMNFFNLDHPEHKEYRDFVYRHTSIDPHASPLSQAMQYWVQWNTQIEKYAHSRVKIESFHTKIHLNARERSNITTFADLPGGTIRDQLRVKAIEYGYPN